jgi:hypothetical protein
LIEDIGADLLVQIPSIQSAFAQINIQVGLGNVAGISIANDSLRAQIQLMNRNASGIVTLNAIRR